jgi:hypothetical protein
VYEIDWDQLAKIEIGVVRAGPRSGQAADTTTQTVGTYGDLRHALLTEGVLDCDWRRAGHIFTSEAKYSIKELRGPETWIWQILCLDCHLVAKLKSDVRQGRWYLYAITRNRANFETIESFFVTARDEIVEQCFSIDQPAGRDHLAGSEELVALGVWRQIKPVEIQTDEHYETRMETVARSIGSIRAAYKNFYEETTAGRVHVATPAVERFDALHYWLDAEPIPDVGTTVVALKMDIIALDQRVAALRRLVVSTILVAAVLAAIEWFRRW